MKTYLKHFWKEVEKEHKNILAILLFIIIVYPLYLLFDGIKSIDDFDKSLKIILLISSGIACVAFVILLAKAFFNSLHKS